MSEERSATAVDPSWIPGPPPGPGVRVPFAVPPTERDRKRFWVTFGVGGAALLLCCAGGVVGVGALVVAGTKALPTEARSTVRDFLDGLAHRDYRGAYDQVCTSRRSAQSLDEFTAQERDRPPIQRFTLVATAAQGSRFQVSAQVQTPESTGTEVYTVISDRKAGALRVCGGPR